MKKLFILYDSRALLESTDEASIYVVCSSEQEALDFARDWPDSVTFEYDDDDDSELRNETLRLDLSHKLWRRES